MNFVASLRPYIQLTKPTIVFSFTMTGVAALVMEGRLITHPLQFFLVVVAILLTAASANGLNQYLERDLDAQMERTRTRRPLPLAQIQPNQALFFSIAIGVIAVLYLAIFVNLLSAGYALGTILFYSFFYTLWLKPRTPYNIVIGGAAGATAPLIAWAAAAGTTTLPAWVLFLIIFLWTPPHFWALALGVKEQYARAGIPMLPVVKGEDRTIEEIWWYVVFLVPLTLSLTLLGFAGFLYLGGAAILNLIWLWLGWLLWRQRTKQRAFGFFRFSILYLMLLFLLLIVDSWAKF